MVGKISKPKLAVDLDETVVYLLRHFLDFYNAKHSTGFSEEHFFSYNWWEVLGISKERAYAEAAEYIQDKIKIYKSPEFFDGRFYIEFVEGVEPALDLLCRFYDLHALSDRSPMLEPDTFNISSWLCAEDCEGGTYFPDLPFPEDHEPLLLPMDKIVLTQEAGLTKPQFCRQAGILTAIDDNPDVAQDYARNGIRAIVLAKPWNRYVSKHPLITRIKDWQEACNILVPGKIKLPEAEKSVYI